MEIVILTTAQADEVRRPTADGSALDPQPLAGGGGFFLPARVLADPNHQEALELLASLPRRDLDLETDLISETEG